MLKIHFSQADPTLRRDVAVYPDFITQEQHDALVEQLAPVFRRKRYEKGHWDAVITDYKESERADESWNQTNRDTIEQIRTSNVMPPGLGPWLPVHAIDLSAQGHIKPHVDSVKFSGKVVAGLSLLSTALMTLRHEDTGATAALLLPPRSFYMLQGDARYRCTHEVSPADADGAVTWHGKAYPRGRRISLIFRDALVAGSGGGGGGGVSAGGAPGYGYGAPQ
ncbi:hypothetical protein JKP88DRAFT_307445 [Tribonema minus]|uniref:Alpha-ketoglutarate-dependent dioxygenase AlkB-like domain-containing protein n=1 Tax=Tribonema minus TaxID=303371 RepID=A0A835Z757_9STRA|nr:hypothetical protein JKP88DRAFT_307445 [Tribonema minus]